MSQEKLPAVASFSNRDTQAARRYHRETNHSYESVRRSSHRLVWENQPLPFKIYSSLEPLELPGTLPSSGAAALEALTARPCMDYRGPTLEELASLLFYTGGVTKVGRMAGGGSMYFRAAACTGALYHIEVYLVCGPNAGLDAGVYHFGPHDFSLRKLRDGDYRRTLVEASGGNPALAEAPAALVFTSVFWRNSWKYQARAYRHSFWDSGVMLANTLAVGTALRLPVSIVSGFVDRQVNELLGLDEDREAALQVVAVGRDNSPSMGPATGTTALDLEVQPYSRWEVDYPAIREMHGASGLKSPEEAAAHRDAPPLPGCPRPSGPEFPLASAPEEDGIGRELEETIRRRGSSRRFRQADIGYSQLSAMLRGAAAPISADFLEGSDANINQMYLIVNSVDGLPSGSYVFNPARDVLEQLAEGDFRRQAGYLDLGQELAADSSVNVYFLADLEPVLERFGNRGYRMAQMEASIMGGRLYLGAYAQGLGATGLTFFDDDVVEFFSPHAAGKSVMFLVAIGRPQRRPQSLGRTIPLTAS